MKVFKFSIIIVICFSCSNNRNREEQNILENERNDSVNTMIEKHDIVTIHETDKHTIQESLSDEELVNKASKLQVEAGGNPISVDDTLKLEKALTYLNKALEVNNNNDVAYSNMVTVLCILERYREAIYILEKSIERKSNFAEGYSYKGFIYEKLGILDTAQIMYHKAIKAYSQRLKERNNINDEINRAFLLFFTKGEKEALSEINFIIKNNPNNNYAYNMKYIFENFNREEFIEENLR